MIETNKKCLETNLKKFVEESYRILYKKISNKSISAENEATLQLHFSYILNTLGKLYEISKEDKIFIELEKKFILKNTRNKSETKNAICDIYLELQDNVETKKCCIELKFFKKKIRENRIIDMIIFLT